MLLLIFTTTLMTEQNQINEIEIYPKLLISFEDGNENEDKILADPSFIKTDSKGNIYIINSKDNIILKYNRNLEIITKWGGAGYGPGEFQFTGPLDSMTVDSNDLLYVVDRGQARIQIFNEAGKYIDGFQTHGEWPCSIAVDRKGKIYLAFAPVISLNNPYLIEVYKKTKNGYVKENSYSHAPLWFGADNNISRKIIFKLKDLNTSLICHNDDDELFQVFVNLPLIRKYSRTGKLIWEKTLDMEKLSKINKEQITSYKLLINYRNLKLEQLNEIDERIFATSINYCSDRESILISITQQSAVLEIDVEGNLENVFYPPKILQFDPENFKNKSDITLTGSLINASFFYSTYDLLSGRLLTVGIVTGELWKTELPEKGR